MGKNLLLILLSLAAVLLSIAPPGFANDGFSGSYSQVPPQQWQPLSQGYPQGQYAQPGQQYGQPQQAPYAQGQYAQPGQQYGQAQQAPYAQGQYAQPGQQYGQAQQQAPYAQGQYAQAGQQYGQQQPAPYEQSQSGQSPTYYGYANEQQAQQYAQQTAGYGQGAPQSYGGPPNGAGYSGPPQGRQGNLQAQADGYFNSLDQGQNAQNAQSAQATQDSSDQTESSGSGAGAGLKKAGKILAGVGASVAGAYIMNRAYRKSPMGMMGVPPQYGMPMMSPGYGGGYGGYGGYGCPPGYGTPGMPVYGSPMGGGLMRGLMGF